MIKSDIRDHAYQFFVEEAPELLQAIEEGLLTIREQKDKAKVHSIMRAAHSIKGGAASVELEGIKTIAHRLEDIFKALYSDEIEIDGYLESLLLQGYDCLKDPLMEQIDTGNYDEQQAVDQAESVLRRIEDELGDALTQADDYLPSSEDLGIDIVSSIFEVDVAQELDRLTQVVNNPQNYEVAGELRATGEVFAGFAELLNLPGFGQIATVAEQALECNHDHALEITKLAIADFRSAREQVLQGDRKEGGKPSEALLAFTQVQTVSESVKVQPPTTETDRDSTGDDLHDHAYQFFIEEAPELLQLIEDGLLKLRQEKTPALVHEVMRAAHSLKGGSASVGLDGIKTLAHRLEDIFKALYSDKVEINEYLEGLLLKGYDCLRIPLMEQIETGSHNPEEALAEGLPIMEDIEAQLGDAMTEAEDYIPSSADLGIDVVSSLFEVDVVEGLAQLSQALETGDPQTMANTLRSQVEIFDGFAEMLNLPGFGQIGQTAISALDQDPEQVLRIVTLALQDYQKAHEDVMNGDRDQGGSPCAELLSLASQGEIASFDLNDIEETELNFEESDFNFDDLIIEDQGENILLTVSEGSEDEFSNIFDDGNIEDVVFENIDLGESELLPVDNLFEDVILEETPVISQEELLPVDNLFEDVILEETPVISQEELLPVDNLFEDVILEENPVISQEELLPVDNLFEDVILEETPVISQEELLPVDNLFEDVILEDTPVISQAEKLPLLEDLFEDSFKTDATIILENQLVSEDKPEITKSSLCLDDVFNEIEIEETLNLDDVFNEVEAEKTPTLDDVFTHFAEQEEPLKKKEVKLQLESTEILEELQDETKDETIIIENPLAEITPEEMVTPSTIKPEVVKSEKIEEIEEKLPISVAEILISQPEVVKGEKIEELKEKAPIPVAKTPLINIEVTQEKAPAQNAVELAINSVEKAFNQLPQDQAINKLAQQAEQKLNQVKNQQKAQPLKRKPQASPTANLSVRVDLNRLERMNDLVGELAINRNSLSLQNEQLQRQVQDLFSRFINFQNLTKELQLLSDKMLISTEKQQTSEMKSYRPHSLSEVQELITSTEEFDSLEMDRYNHLHSMLQSVLEEIMILEEAVDDIVLYARQSNQTIEDQRQMLTRLRDELMWARMLPLGEVLRRFPRVLRDLSHKHQKPVNLKLTGTGVLVDKAVLEKLYDPLLHLLRNAFDHGIENAQDRKKRKKPEEGTIAIRAYHQGSQTIIEISDDGEGLQLEKIGKRAVERGLLSPGQLAEIEPTQLLDFIFEPGFSTAEKVSELSGRGVGLDVVRSQLRSLKGNVSVNSQPGKGTSFILSLPLTLTIAKLLVCIVGSTAIAFPSDSIEEIIVPKANQMHKSGSQRFLYWREQAVPTYSLNDLLDYGCPLPDLLPSKALGSVNTPENWALPLLIIRQESQYWALEIDRLVTEQELVVKPFGNAINPPPYIYGCTILGDGSLVPVIEGNTLIEKALEGSNTRVIQPKLNLTTAIEEPLTTTEDTPQTLTSTPDTITSANLQISIPRILVVDDSAALRRTLAFSLQKAGYRVLQAKDGKEALQQLQQGSVVDLVICDVEMPNMNGFEFLGQRRREASIKDIPVAMLTSRSNDKHRRLAMQLGASAYFSKPYVEQEFLVAIKDLILQKNPAMASALR